MSPLGRQVLSLASLPKLLLEPAATVRQMTKTVTPYVTRLFPLYVTQDGMVVRMIGQQFSFPWTSCGAAPPLTRFAVMIHVRVPFRNHISQLPSVL